MTNTLLPICVTFLVVGLFLYLLKSELDNIKIMVSSEYIERYRAIVPLLLLLIIVIILLTLAILCTYSRVRILFGLSEATSGPNHRNGSQIFFSLIQLNISGRSLSSNSLFTESGVVTADDQGPPPEYSSVVFEAPKTVKLSQMFQVALDEDDDEEREEAETEPPAYDTIILARTESCDSSSTPEPMSRPSSLARLNTGVSVSRDVNIQMDRTHRFSDGSLQFSTTKL